MTVARVFPLVVKLLAVPFTASAQLRPAPDSTRRAPELHLPLGADERLQDHIA